MTPKTPPTPDIKETESKSTNINGKKAKYKILVNIFMIKCFM